MTSIQTDKYFTWRKHLDCSVKRLISGIHEKIIPVRIVKAVLSCVECPFPHKIGRGSKISILIGQRTIRKIVPWVSVTAFDRPGSLKTSQVCGSQIRIFFILQKSVIGLKCKIIIPSCDIRWWEGVFLTDGVVVISPLEQLFVSIRIFLITAYLIGCFHKCQRFQTIDAAVHVSVWSQ